MHKFEQVFANYVIADFENINHFLRKKTGLENFARFKRKYLH